MPTKPYDGRIVGSATHIPLADASVHLVCTSVPYWGLRSYQIPDVVFDGDANHRHQFGEKQLRGGSAGKQGRTSVRPNRSNADAQIQRGQSQGAFCDCGAWLGQLGLEPDYRDYVRHIVQVFVEIQRVLRPDGSCWLNISDCYATGAGAVGEHPGGGKQGEVWKNGHEGKHQYLTGVANTKDRKSAKGVGPLLQPNRMPQSGLKPKDLCLIPYRVVLALQDAGWWVRSEITWVKPAPMPESVQDRPTSATEKIYLLTKSQDYFYDAVNGREPCVSDRGSGNGFKREARLTYQDDDGPRGSDEPWPLSLSRNMRNYWVLNSEPLNEPHYAAYPSTIPERAITIGTSDYGCCADCGAPYERIIEKQFYGDWHPDQTLKNDGVNRNHNNGAKRRKMQEQASGHRMINNVQADRDAGGPHDQPFLPPKTIGWEKPCRCSTEARVPAIVLDPFGGSGTTALVAEKLNRRWVLLDMGYQDMQKRRLTNIQKQLLTGGVV